MGKTVSCFKRKRPKRPIRPRCAKCCFRFIKRTTGVVTSNTFRSLPLENISLAVNYVYAVKNIGNADSEVRIQVGPAKNSLADDLDGIITVPARETKIITPLLFSKYIRLLYRSGFPGHSTKLCITYQAQVKKR